MGRGIVYCAACGNKILDKEFESRAAIHLDGRGFCKQCAPEALKSLPPDRMTEALAQISQAESGSRLKAPPPPRQPSSKGLPAAAPATRRQASDGSKSGLIVAAVAGAAALVALLVWGMSGSTPPPPPPPPKDTAERPPKVDREAAADRALRLAREFRDANPKDLATQTAGFERVASDFKGTRAADDARRDLEELRRRAREILEAEFKLLQEEARNTSSSEEFQKAIEALTAARGRHPEPSWTQGIDRTLAEIRALPEKLYPAVKTAAVDRRTRRPSRCRRRRAGSAGRRAG
jgi:hypothetical protein